MTDMTSKAGRTARDDVAEAPDDDKERVAKVMARAGLCSRRDAESWIKAGRVAVNGTTITSPALNIGPDDTVAVDGRPIEAREHTRLFLYHKPRGLVTTAKDPEGRATVFDNLPEGLPRVVSVGRLDINTEGLLLLTNDGGLARVLELPSTGWLRRYRVRANGSVTQEALDALRGGLTLDGVDYAGIEATLDRMQGANVWLTMGLREGKNREIKRVLEHLGLYVNRLIRMSFGPFQLGELAEGAAEEIRTRVLRDQLGEVLAREAGVDWDDAVTARVVTEEKGRAERDAGPRGAAPRGRRDKQPAPERPRQDRPAPSARPHVSALRAERSTRGDEPRKRITRESTADRKGRTVAIERVTTVEGKERHKGEGGTSRNARNFARERRDTGEEALPERRARPTAERPSPARPDAPRARASRGGFGSDRPATGRALKEGPPRTPRAGRSDTAAAARPPRAGRSSDAPGGRFPRPERSGDAPGGRAPRPGRSGDAPGRPPRAGRSGDAPGGRFPRPERSGDAPGGRPPRPGRSSDAPGGRTSRPPRSGPPSGSGPKGRGGGGGKPRGRS